MPILSLLQILEDNHDERTLQSYLHLRQAIKGAWEVVSVEYLVDLFSSMTMDRILNIEIWLVQNERFCGAHIHVLIM